MGAPLLSVEDLVTVFRTDEGVVRAVDGVSFTLDARRTLALVGESGCGKSVTSLSLLRLVPSPPGAIEGGRVLLEGRDLLALPERALTQVRGEQLAMIFQEPMSALNPVMKVGAQVAEGYRAHRAASRQEARERAVEMLRAVGIPDPAHRYRAYPHELSGGMRQRVMIAMALICGPKVLIADEPTTALDVTVQAQILELIERLSDELGMATLFITHDLGVVAEVADEVAVMYAGRIVEQAAVEALFAEPLHPYTRGLLASVPSRQAGGEARRLRTIPGSVPSSPWPVGCRFQDRCALVEARCREAYPPLRTLEGGRRLACWVVAGDDEAAA
ncbi:MAG: ABC transporter ATP-binding protein [Sandaracinaceae bacterium]